MATQKMIPSSVSSTELPYPEKRIDQLMSVNGDGSGQTEMADSAAEYKFIASADCFIRRMLIAMESASRMSPDEYGDLAALANGCLITVKDSNDNVIHNISPNPIKKTWHYGLLAGSDVQPSAFEAGSDRTLIRFTLQNGGYDLRLRQNEYLSFEVQDDLSGLTSHLIQVQGYFL